MAQSTSQIDPQNEETHNSDLSQTLIVQVNQFLLSFWGSP